MISFNRLNRRVFQGSVAGLVMMTSAASVCHAKPITYQGQLNLEGMPAVGMFDIQAKLFDSSSLGEQIGQTVIFEDYTVEAGLLELDLDFGEVFDSADVYLEISVRDGLSQAPLDILSPRQRINAIPKAIHAATADALTDGNWNGGQDIFGSRILWFGEGQDRVLINREDPVSKTEYFGVHTENAGIGGIVISNSDANAITLLTHAPGNMPRASESFNGRTKQWSLEIEQNFVMTVNSAGVKAAHFQYKAPVAGAITVAGDAFHSAFGTPFRASFFGGGAYLSTPGDNSPLVAPVSLPNGAVVTKIVARFEDNVASDLSVSLTGAQANGTLITIGSVSSAGIPPMAGIQTLMTETIDAENATVNSYTAGHYLRVFSGSWPGDSSLRIWSVTVEYTVTQPD